MDENERNKPNNTSERTGEGVVPGGTAEPVLPPAPQVPKENLEPPPEVPKEDLPPPPQVGTEDLYSAPEVPREQFSPAP